MGQNKTIIEKDFYNNFKLYSCGLHIHGLYICGPDSVWVPQTHDQPDLAPPLEVIGVDLWLPSESFPKPAEVTYNHLELNR